MLGLGFTVTVTVAEPVQPEVVPVTVYVVVEVGFTVFELPVPRLWLQEYDEAPDAFKTELCPLHIEGGVAVAVRVGFGFTVTVTVAEPVHPAEDVPVTVYVVVEVGFTVFELPVPRPWLHE